MTLLFGLTLILSSAFGQTTCSSVLNTSPPSLGIIFKKMAIARGARKPGHPDLIANEEFARLKVGQTIFIDGQHLRTRMFQPHVGRILRFEVRGAGDNKLDIFSNKYGMVYLSDDTLEDLWGHVYRRDRFYRRSRFLPGEYVRVGWPGPSTFARNVDLYDYSADRIQPLNANSVPMVMKFVRTLNQEFAVVQVMNLGGKVWQYRVATRDLYPLEVGHGGRLKQILQPLNQIPLARVNWGGGEPRLVRIDTNGYLPEEPIPFLTFAGAKKFVRAFLDGALRVESHPEFLAAQFEDRLQRLVEYQDLIVPWDKAGLNLEVAGIREFSEVICAGVGVCRHKTPLLAAIFAEAGLKFRILYRIRTLKSGKLDGHTWLEVDEPYGAKKTYVVDPSDGLVETLDHILALAKAAPASSAAIWWGHPRRLELPIEEIR